MWYIRIYKTIYLIIITINLFLSFTGYVNYGLEYLVPQGINILAIALNIFTFFNLEHRPPRYILIEKVLSVLRIIAILLIASLIFGGVIMQIIPTGIVLWASIIKMNPSIKVLWLICLMLLILEIVYFIKLKWLRRYKQ